MQVLYCSDSNYFINLCNLEAITNFIFIAESNSGTMKTK